ncbi:HAMP domain-containing protein [bacterium]|nr:HAMP domain-containing protein [bacterium]
MSLRKKVLLENGLGLGLVVLIVAWSVYNLLSLGQTSESILRENYQSILAAYDMHIALDNQDMIIRDDLRNLRPKGQLEFKKSEDIFRRALGKARDHVYVRGEAEIVDSIETQYGRYVAEFFDRFILEPSLSDSLATSYQGSFLTLSDRIHGSFIKLSDLNQSSMYESSLRSRLVATRAAWSMIAIGAVVLVIGLLFSLLLSNYLVSPLKRLMEASRLIALGDYSVRMPLESRDEFGQLSQEFNRMAGELAAFHEMHVDRILAEKHKTEAILQGIEEGVMVLEPDLRLSTINSAAIRLLELKKYTPGTSAAFTELIEHEGLIHAVRSLAETGKIPAMEDSQRLIAIPLKQSVRYLLFSVTPAWNKEGGLAAILILLIDVTRLGELDRLKNEFIMAASHELRTPLTSIGMSIELLMEHVSEQLKPRERELLTSASSEIKRLKTLVSDLLDLSKIESGVIELDFQRLQPAVVVERAVSLLADQMETKKIIFRQDIPASLPEVRADADKTVWVLTNLIGNATRYVDAGGEIKLSAQARGQFMHFSVSDNGPGIAKEHQSKIFEKFVQIKDYGKVGGAGLGLSISREIVRAHGGTIWVDSIPGSGSTFTFTLPLV